MTAGAHEVCCHSERSARETQAGTLLGMTGGA
jgi:hypothetical protein